MPLLYHGTRCSSLSSIATNGMLPSSQGRLGPGVYLSTLDVARRVATHRNQGSTVAVAVVQVDLGAVCEHGTSNDPNGSWAASGAYNSCHGTHPKWLGIGPFDEWCVRDTSRCRVVEVQVVDGVLSGNMDFPGGTLTVSGNSTITCSSIRCDRIVIGE